MPSWRSQHGVPFAPPGISYPSQQKKKKTPTVRVRPISKAAGIVTGEQMGAARGMAGTRPVRYDFHPRQLRLANDASRSKRCSTPTTCALVADSAPYRDAGHPCSVSRRHPFPFDGDHRQVIANSSCGRSRDLDTRSALGSQAEQQLASVASSAIYFSAERTAWNIPRSQGVILTPPRIQVCSRPDTCVLGQVHSPVQQRRTSVQSSRVRILAGRKSRPSADAALFSASTSSARQHGRLSRLLTSERACARVNLDAH